MKKTNPPIYIDVSIHERLQQLLHHYLTHSNFDELLQHSGTLNNLLRLQAHMPAAATPPDAERQQLIDALMQRFAQLCTETEAVKKRARVRKKPVT